MNLTINKSPENPIENTIVNKIKHSKQIISDAIKEHGDKVEVACSFGKDSMVVVHLALQVKPDIRIFSIMTPFKPKETFEYKDKMIQHYNLNLVEYMSKERVDPNLPKTDPDEC
ncbi:MAG: phosphoadenosine phosphosulfate reductase family protein, partial [Candidatus Heimdallarchaeota archaeon]|nr:phosphoadenosine phosphosulfate reductase family protein [Candidatus Heimdallarchaeota archaeon]